MTSVTIKLYQVGKRDPITLPWPDGAPWPTWGETFVFNGEPWQIIDTVWEYKSDPLHPMDVTYNIYLGEDGELDEDEGWE